MDDSKEVRIPIGWGIRLGVLLLATSILPIGLWALVSPRSFYEDFPAAGRHWVSALGPYNEHLISDVGAAYLAMSVMLFSAGILLHRSLVRVSLIAWLAFAVPHFAFHLTTFETFSLTDNLASLGGLGLVVLLPLVLLMFTRNSSIHKEVDDGTSKSRTRT